jgi:hypothetical protein
MKHHKPIAVLLLIVICASPAYSQSSSATLGATEDAEQNKLQFPLWVRDLRRAEIIAFGAFPFMMFLATFSIDTYRAATHDWDSRYFPWPAKGPGAIEMSTDERLLTLGFAISGSLAIALADHLIVRVKRAREEKQRLDLPEGDIIILHRPWPPEDADEAAAEDAADETAAGEAARNQAAEGGAESAP